MFNRSSTDSVAINVWMITLQQLLRFSLGTDVSVFFSSSNCLAHVISFRYHVAYCFMSLPHAMEGLHGSPWVPMGQVPASFCWPPWAPTCCCRPTRWSSGTVRKVLCSPWPWTLGNFARPQMDFGTGCRHRLHMLSVV